jgi:hypothetical protein
MRVKDMSNAQLAVNLALKALILAAILTFVQAIFGAISALIAAAISIGISIGADRMADKQIEPNFSYYAWKYLPTLIFVVFPLLSVLWRAFSSDEEKSMSLEDLYNGLRIILTFVAPMILLFFADLKL